MISLKNRSKADTDYAKTITEIVNQKNDYAQTIMDRGQEITEELVGSVIAQGIMSYSGRKPKPALDKNGNFQTTDLDLLSFLVPLAARKAVIEIPEYRNRRQIVKRENERRIGTNHFGPITSLVSNKDVFSFSVKIHDKTIVGKDSEGQETIGDFRNYMVVDCDGHWYDGWNKMSWDPSKEENRFLFEKKLWTNNSVFFKYSLHPNRWQSVFGAPYFLKKMLIARINDEAEFLRKEMKRLEIAGVQLPETEKKENSVIEKGNIKTLTVKTMEMILSLPEFSGAYKPVPCTTEGYREAYCRQKQLTYKWKPAIQFVVRANEAAYMRFGLNEKNEGKIAYWMGNCQWKPYRKNSRSALYNQIVLSEDIALRYRVKTKTEAVSA